MNTTKDEAIRRVNLMIAEGRQAVQSCDRSGWDTQVIPAQIFTKWQAGCLLLAGSLGLAKNQWPWVYRDIINDLVHAQALLGSLEAIRDGIQNGLLLGMESLARSEAFESLLEQGDYLLSEGYALAAGVIGRAVLEEHLRKLCEAKGCGPTKPKPTMNDFKDSLYKAKVIDTTQMKHVEATAAVGNDCAHNKPHTADDVKRMLRDVRDIMLRHPIA